MRRRFARRILFALVALFLVLVVAGWTLGAVFGWGWNPGPRDHRGGFPFGIFLFLGLAAVFVVVVRAVRRAARPVGEVMEGVARVADGDLSARVEPRGGGDDRRLAQAFNRMAERLETDESRRRDLLADLAHELRTPLAVIRGNVEAMLDGLYPTDPAHLQTVLDEADVLGRLLEDLRTLSTAEAGALVLHIEPVDPGALVEEAVAAFRVQAGEAKVELRTDVAAALPAIEVDPVRIGEVLANLLQNALRHTPAGGTVTVAAARSTSEGAPAVTLSVIDDGPGIPAELLPHVFERFVRSADSGGSGLGLAIARSLVEAHGGAIAAPPPGRGGTTITVTLGLAGRGRSAHDTPSA
jgi:two-component system, OmpR family, sensor histidine kinase BaeS